MFMERGMIVEHLRKKRKIVILTFALLIIAFLENFYLNCYQAYYGTSCELGVIFLVLAAIMISVVFYYRK